MVIDPFVEPCEQRQRAGCAQREAPARVKLLFFGVSFDEVFESSPTPQLRDGQERSQVLSDPHVIQLSHPGWQPQGHGESVDSLHCPYASQVSEPLQRM